MSEELDMLEVMDEYRTYNKLFSMEMASGVQKLSKLIGHLDHNYGNKYYFNGSKVEDFLADNPGAIEALIDWIIDNDDGTWKESLLSTLPEEENDE